ncbi:mrna binding post-transcriptional regulator [Moniliophthora roreri MCA 2997]|uniref:Mrna binding post-transcriptional regulator n=1 Tax=Moniliophthora roreri (strain MCA 2997) TaxID=1381753 RepID=V2XFJ0_MONRO|nr:mrna binding post-transcriptional regulator [Moniliophthora roreri MCA 2997]
MARTEGYDYPPGLGHSGLQRLWDTGEQGTLLGHTVTSPSSSTTSISFADSSSITLRTLFWGDLEPWMDEEYVKQVCALMGWDPQSIKVPPPTGPNANNPGYCFLTFRSPAHASSVLAQLNSSATPPIMPNSAKPFNMNWANSVQLSSSVPTPTSFSPNQQQYPAEYSIFVGDLAPETSNSDLVAVFRNPVLGLRNDREPKFIRPFLSCKSAKIMLDPVTGVSRGYGFVRFTDEADQQRALIEMHGLYCLSRPMRISPATAKFKPPPTSVPPTHSFSSPFHINPTSPGISQPIPTMMPMATTGASTNVANGSNQPKSVSSPIAVPVSSNTGSDGGSNGSTSPGASGTTSSSSNGSLASSATAISSGGSDTDVKLLAQLAQQYAANGAASKYDNTSNATQQPTQPGEWADANATRYLLSEESWKHHAQARAILGNLIGPNGEQLTSTDPYNTTVFVGGLSPLINEDTLRTFFAPFGDIHYVKVPVGKNCGFVQFVRKVDAERAIEKMQGFPIGGSRIRLSWGRSQYKAAQAAAQAAQAAAIQGQQQGPLTGVNLNSLTQEQAIQLLQKLSVGGYMDVPVAADEKQHGRQMGMHTPSTGYEQQYGNAHHPGLPSAGLYAEEKLRAAHLASREDAHGHGTCGSGAGGSGGMFEHGLFSQFDGQDNSSQRSHSQLLNPHSLMSTFSPFSPDPNAAKVEVASRDSAVSNVSSVNGGGENHRLHLLNGQGHGAGGTQAPGSTTIKMSPSNTRHTSGLSRYGNFTGQNSANLSVGSPVSRSGVVISRPSSGQHYQQHQQQHQQQESFDSMHDLNGTLASLDLDSAASSPRPDMIAPTSTLRGGIQVYAHSWRNGLKSPTGGSESGASGSSGSGQETVQLQLTRPGMDGDRGALRAVSPM